MPVPTTLAECREAYAADVAHKLPADMRTLLNRAFMLGAMSAIQLQQTGIPRDAVLAECVQFGRAVGTPAESA